MNARIEYIDRLKGFAMIMVVAGHLITFCGLGYENSYMTHILLINMPLFLFLNGLMVSKITLNGSGEYLLKKARQILLPFISWGGVIVIYKGESYLNFLFHFWKFGYWYLVVLFELYLIYVSIQVVSLKLGKSDKVRNMVLVGGLVVFYSILRQSARFLPDSVHALTSYYQIVEYYPFFFAGVLVKFFDISRIFLLRRNVVMTGLLLLTSILYYIWQEGMYMPVVTFGLRITGVLSVYMIFMLLDNRNQPDGSMSGINTVLKTVGMHTLSIYMIQYFFFKIINLEPLMLMLETSGNQLALVLITVIVSVLLCFLCIGVEKIISTSGMLSMIFLGKSTGSYAKISRA